MLGDDFLAYLTLALGAALFVGNGMALIKPRRAGPDGDVVRPPLAWSLLQIAIGGLAAIWALATIVT
jgi:hypothetical protein